MNIGVDLDGVLFDSESLLRTVSVFYDLEICGKGIVDKTANFCQDAYGWDKKQSQTFLDKYLLQCEKVAPVMPYAKYVIDKLREAGHKVYIITRRGWEDKKEITLTNKLLKKNKIKVDAVYYSKDSKLKTCQDLMIDIMIDDNSKTIETLANNNIRCFYYTGVFSRELSHPLITDVNNWGDIYLNILKTSK